MKNEQPRTERTNHVSWSMQQALNLGLPSRSVLMLDVIISTVDAHCKSIILCGSWADGTSTNQSDLDLLFITEEEDEKNAVITSLVRLLSKPQKPVYDCRVLSRQDILRLSEGTQHFALWLLLSTGIVISGSVLNDIVKLDLEKVRVLLSNILERINHCIASLESNIHYAGACLHSAYIARTLFFIDKHLLRNGHHPELKKAYIKRLIGPPFKTVEKLYNEIAVSKKPFGELGVIPRVCTRDGLRYSKEQYHELYDACTKLESSIQDLRFQVQSKLLP